MDHSIIAKDLTKRFGDFTAVDAISFQVKRGEIFGFLGANGAGKTTAIKMLIGLSIPTDGEIEVAGLDMKGNREQVKRRIGYMSQKFSLYEDLSIRQNIRFYGGIYGLSPKNIKEKIREIIHRLDLKEYAKRVVADLPLGWKQRLAFAVASMHDPQIIFLDEPTGGVDPKTRRQFWEMIYAAADRGVTILVTTHYMDEAEYCDRVSIMVGGRIDALGTPRELKKQFDSTSMDEVFLKLVRG
ncbi:MAG TPA: ABC transporter ATP-binding protein [Saprospiraceae bacterium]|nr:ABC transporter ATP-binding protein [Saprospiraceae bacterium]